MLATRPGSIGHAASPATCRLGREHGAIRGRALNQMIVDGGNLQDRRLAGSELAPALERLCTSKNQ